MNDRIIRFSAPERLPATLARGAALTAAGAAAGAVIATAANVYNAIPILIGLAIGVCLGTRTSNESGGDGHMAGGLLAVGSVALAGAGFEAGLPFAAWIAALLGLGIAASAGEGLSVRRVTGAAMGAGLGFVAIYALVEGLRLHWGVYDYGFTAAAGALVGATTHLGRSATGALRIDVAREVSAGAIATRANGTVPTGDFDARQSMLPDEWGTAYRSLELRAAELLSMIDELGAQRPDDLVLAGEIRSGVERMVSDARDAVARWMYADPAGAEARRADLEVRVAENEGRLVAETDPRVRAALEAALQRQRRALSLVDDVVAARRAFGYRLEEASASLDVLRTSLGRALTAGGCLDQAEVDLLVEAMNDAHALFETEVTDGVGAVPPTGPSQAPVAVAFASDAELGA